jgi:hypothetical protein
MDAILDRVSTRIKQITIRPHEHHEPLLIRVSVSLYQATQADLVNIPNLVPAEIAVDQRLAARVPCM